MGFLSCVSSFAQQKKIEWLDLGSRYTKGTALFRSDSITTISVLKDIISKEATAKKIQVSMNVDVKDTWPAFFAGGWQFHEEILSFVEGQQIYYS